MDLGLCISSLKMLCIEVLRISWYLFQLIANFDLHWLLIYLSIYLGFYLYVYIYTYLIIRFDLIIRKSGSLTITFIGKFVNIAHHFILLQLSFLTLVLIRGNGCLSSLCHIYGFHYQETVIKTFPGTGYLYSDDGII